MSVVDHSLSGVEFLRELMAGRAPNSAMNELLGLAVVEVEEGRIVIEGKPTGAVYNLNGVVHGGWTLTLIDTSCGLAARSTLPPGMTNASVETNAKFIRPITSAMAPIRCEANVLNNGRRVKFSEAKVFDKDGKILAHGSSTLLVSAIESKG
jgi:uncharacterized protein (TIGR00369 family)